MRGKSKLAERIDNIRKPKMEEAISPPFPSGVKVELEKVEPLKDLRLDKVIPLIVGMLSKLLRAKGMMRYDKDFKMKVKEIMDGEKKND